MPYDKVNGEHSMKKTFALITVGLIGCGSSSPSVFGTTTNTNESSTNTTTTTTTPTATTSTSLGGAGGSTTSTSSSSSSSSGSGGEGGSSCVPSVTCADKECGTIKDDGCGNSVECPDNCVAPFVCGGNGSQFKCGCAPKSCLDQGKNCGTIDDLCGGKVDCGGCDTKTNPYSKCGFAKPLPDGSSGVGVDNVCGGGCTEANPQSYDCGFNKTLYYCYDFSINAAPFEGCIKIGVGQWCC